MIPFLLDKNKSLATLVSDRTGGVGEITGAFDGRAIEEANGLKEISFKLPIDSSRYSQIEVGSYLKVKADEYHDLQIYEIYRITKPIDGIVTIYAQHISYILGKATVNPFTSTGITQTCQKMLQNLVGTYPFTFTSDIVNTESSFTLDVPMSFRKAIGGWKGSILDTFGGELDWDNLDVHLYASRGQDKGVKIEYGKNLTSLTQEENIANVYDAVIGYATINDIVHVGDIQKITTTDSPRTLNVDFSDKFDSQTTYTDEQIKTLLNSYALSYAQNNDIGKPKVNLKVSFEVLSKFEEYKDIALLEQTALFDKITILFSKLGVEATAKIIRTEYDFINEKMISVELGDAKTNLLGLVDEQIESQLNDLDIDTEDIEKALGFLDEYVDNLSNIITNGLGLFFTKVAKTGGGYQYYLHDKPLLANSTNQWTINSSGFALSTDGGQTWVAGIDAQGNAVLNSLATVTLRALNIYGSYIEGSQILFGDSSNKYILAQVYNDGTNDIGVTFDGTGTIRMQPQTEFTIENQSVDETVKYNRIRVYTSELSTGAVQNIIRLDNSIGDSTSFSDANYINLYSRTATDGSSFEYNSLLLYNKRDNDKNANYINLIANSSGNTLTIANRDLSDILNANSIVLKATSSGYNITIQNRAGDGTTTTINSITMDTGTTNQIEIKSVGSVILQSTANDIDITSSDSVHINGADKVRINGANGIWLNNQQIYFDNGVVKYYV